MLLCMLGLAQIKAASHVSGAERLAGPIFSREVTGRLAGWLVCTTCTTLCLCIRHVLIFLKKGS